MKWKIMLPLALCFLFGSVYYVVYVKNPSAVSLYPYDTRMEVGGQVLYVEIADTPQKQRLGLSGREPLAPFQGMLFDFGNQANKAPSFWMKNMRFEIDILWIRQSKIIGITKKIPAPKSQETLLPRYSPPEPIDQVLEVNAGWTDKFGIRVGDEVQITR